MLQVFAAAFALGLILNVAPGAGSPSPSGGLLFRMDSVRFPLGLAGAAYLLWLTRDAWRAANRQVDLGSRGDGPREAHGRVPLVHHLLGRAQGLWMRRPGRTGAEFAPVSDGV